MLAEAAVFGLPIDRLMRSTHPEEVQLLRAVHREAGKVVDDLITNLARRIVNEYATAKERGAKKNQKG